MIETSYQLAAIMFTDIVGYSSLMGADEDQAFEVLRKNQDIHNTIIGQYKGTLIKSIGDGMLISFPLASNAVKCAIAIQKACQAHDIPIKIGIHEGEMAFAGDDVYGDGVNIASRLQESTEKGGILISERVYADIKNKPGLKSAFIGQKKLKNIEEPMKVYEVLYRESGNRARSLLSGFFKPKLLYFSAGLLLIVLTAFLFWYYYPKETLDELEKSIAVLPFENLSEDMEQQYFADGVMLDILTQLQKIGNLRVPPRNSVEKYRDNPLSSPEIGRALNVNFLLSGSIRRSDNLIMITTHLINSKEDNLILTMEYTKEYSAASIFEIQEEIARKVVDELKVIVTPERIESIIKPKTSNTLAYEYFLKGRYYYNLSPNKDAWLLARENLIKAIELDPEFASPYGIMACIHALGSLRGHIATNIDSAEWYAKKGLSLDNNCEWTYKGLGHVEQIKYGNIAKGTEYEKKILDINPNNFNVIHNLKLANYRIGKYDEALKLMKREMEIANARGNAASNLVQLNLELANYKKAYLYYQIYLEEQEKIEFKNLYLIESWRASINKGLGNIDAMVLGIDKLIMETGDSSAYHAKFFLPYWMKKDYGEVIKYYELNNRSIEAGIFEWRVFPHSYLMLGDDNKAKELGTQFLNNLETQARWSEKVYSYNKAVAFMLIQDNAQCFSWLERAIDYGHLADISVDMFFQSIWGEPRFIKLVDKQHKKRKEVMDLVASYNLPEPKDL